VPFVIYDSTNERSGHSIPFDERALEESKLVVEDGWKVMGLLLRGGE
jgi:hypothetical protein